jgi:hypothetical protein
MSQIKIYNYTNFNDKQFIVIAPLKHGSRWLQHINNDYTLTALMHNENSEPTHMIGDGISMFTGDYTKIFKEKLLSYYDINTINHSTKIKVKTNPIKLNKQFNKIYFVYRNVYDCFVSALVTGAQKDAYKWDGTLENLDELMTNTGHFLFNYWRVTSSILSDINVEHNSIEFVELKNLTKLFRLEFLLNVQFNKENFDFSTSIYNGMTKNELINNCKKYHPKLWNNYMITIQEEQNALDTLISQYNTLIINVI